MSAEPDAASAAETAYERLAEAHEDDFRNLVFHQAADLAAVARRRSDAAMLARIRAELADMAERSPNEWIRREAATKLDALGPSA